MTKKRLEVAPSPFNGLKFYLGIGLIVGILLILALPLFAIALYLQLVILLVYSIVLSVALAFRVKNLLRRQKHGQQEQ